MLCCKLHHENDSCCIFRCDYGEHDGGPHDRHATARLRPTWLGAATVSASKRPGRLTNAIWPFFDLFTRLWLAQAFFVSGLLKLANWDTAL